jgi:hypothetical protein
MVSLEENVPVQTTTADGIKIVRCSGGDREVIVPMTVEVLGRSCFQSCHHIESVVFENGSQLRLIGAAAFSGCGFLTSIAIPSSVEIIGDFAFKKCDGLEPCRMDEGADLMRIEKEAFVDCRSLKLVYVPRSVDRIGEDCFNRCCLHRLRVGSSQALGKIVSDVTVDSGLEQIGLSEVSSLSESKLIIEKQI